MRPPQPREIDKRIFIPSVIYNNELIIRGSLHWDIIERSREAAGYSCISLGPIPATDGMAPPSFWRHQ